MLKKFLNKIFNGELTKEEKVSDKSIFNMDKDYEIEAIEALQFMQISSIG
ncbi:hypothetical protein [Clostridium frigidicarnis]|uniref:Uncharacterized protein n=1 Tax=Clostridium frigidicarnis TaxID=84698 RepID=A0A1I0Z6Q2_9CLOT|nr:hypothetical protein [Clostridium frigidicarnis]SFB21295.1 hypothetical protein SAMN04488528_10185 [Clostridium frigidicarnis]